MEEILLNQNIISIFIMILTVYFTSTVNNYFKDKSERKKQITYSLSKIKELGYLIDKNFFHYYETLINSNYLEYKISKFNIQSLNEENSRIISNLSNYFINIYKYYAELHSVLDLLINLSAKSNLELRQKVDNEINILLKFNKFTIPKPKDKKNIENLDKWRDDRIAEIPPLLKEHIEDKFNNIYNLIFTNIK